MSKTRKKESQGLWETAIWKVVVRGISKSQKAHILTNEHLKHGIYKSLCGRQFQHEHMDTVYMHKFWKQYNIHRCQQCEAKLEESYAMTRQIKFRGGIFSNFSFWEIELDGEKWPTTEHYYQAQKAIHDRVYFEKIKKALSASEAAQIGRSHKFEIRADWDLVKIPVMRKALRAKFTQNEVCKNSLLATDFYDLVERTDTDDFWGDGKDGSGQNYLGRLLMETREWIRKGMPDDEI